MKKRIVKILSMIQYERLPIMKNGHTDNCKLFLEFTKKFQFYKNVYLDTQLYVLKY